MYSCWKISWMSEEPLNVTWCTAPCTALPLGRPNHLKQVLRIIQHLRGAWDELSLEASILLKGNHACTPPELLDCTLADLHRTHQGMEKMQVQGSKAVYWPCIDAYIADYIWRCTICTKYKASLLAQPMLPWDILHGLWQEIAADYIHNKGKEYLVICDLFSKYLFLSKVSSQSAYPLSQKLQELISQYRPPSHIDTENSPPFTSDKSTQFLQQQHINHTTSSPYFSQSNISLSDMSRLWRPL